MNPMASAPVVEEEEIVKKKSLWVDAWSRMRRNKLAMFGMFLVLLIIFLAIFAPVIAPYHYDEQNTNIAFQFPSWSHPFGTDNYGRDILSRVIYGARSSLMVGLVSVCVSSTLGGVLGCIAGFYGGKVDNIIMRCIDIVLAIPATLLAIAIAAILGPGLFNAVISIGLSNVGRFTRVVRGAVLTVRGQEYVEAARSINANNFRIIRRYVLPNAFAPMLVEFTLNISTRILSASQLSFLGLGVQPPMPEWGAMLSAGRRFIRDYWYITTFPGLSIMLTVYGFNLLGDGLRDALDPRLKD